MADRQFGIGNKAKDKSFGTATVGQDNPRTVDLVFGEHPHSYSENNIYARYADGSIEEFDGHRIQVKIELETFNYLKESHFSGDEIRKGGEGRIFLNGEQITSYFFREIEYGLTQAKGELTKLMDHPVSWWDAKEREKMVGRKVYYENTPAVVKYLFLDQGCVVLEPEAGHQFPIPAHELEEAKNEGRQPEREERTVKIEFTSKSIWWWRK